MLQVLHNYAIHSNIYFTVNIAGLMRHINCICPGLIRDTAFAALRENDSDWLYGFFGPAREGL